jgi:putative ABC transport system permease protein
MNGIRQDVRYAWRQLLRQRGASAIAVLTLALGIGASTAIFSVVDAALLRPLPYPHPEQLVEVSVEVTAPDGRTYRPTTSMADLRRWQQATDVFTSLAGYGRAFRGHVLEGPSPERLQTAQVTEDYLSMYGVTPVLGRLFTRADVEYGAPSVVLLSSGYWQSHYGGSAGVVGQTMRLDDGVATIIGVLPSWYETATPIFQPLQMPPDMADRRGSGRPSIFGRLRAGVTPAQAAERLSALTPPEPGPHGTRLPVRAIVESQLDSTVAGYSTTVGIVAGAVALILLLACVNVAGLLLARGATRQAELAVRASLGASRGRLIRQLLTESAVLAMAGGAFGLLLAWLALGTIVANLPIRLPANSPVTLNLPVLAATIVLLVPTVLLFGLLPAWRLSRVRPGTALAHGTRQTGSGLSRRGSQVLIAAEVALAVVLVMGAGLMIRSFVQISSVDLGFDPDGAVVMDVLPLEHDAQAQKTYYTELVDRLRKTPGIASVGLVDNFVLGGGSSFTEVTGSGRGVFASIFQMLPGYLETIRARIEGGRLPTPADFASGLHSVVINESAAHALFPDGRAVGRQLTSIYGGPGPWTVVGVIGDLQHGGPLNSRGKGFPEVFFPLNPDPQRLTWSMTVVVRPNRSMPDLANRLRQTAEAIGPPVLVEHIRSADEMFGNLVVTPRRRTVLLGMLGGLGLVLALVGVFGMTAYTVARRTREIGVRMAFGARPAEVVRAVLRDSAVPIVIGTVLGVGGAALATRAIRTFLFNTAPTDPLTFAAVAGTLAAAGCCAALVPAWRAARIDPVVTLRTE